MHVCVLACNRVNHAKSSISKPFQSTNSLAANSLSVKGKLGTIMQQVGRLEKCASVTWYTLMKDRLRTVMIRS